MSDRHDAWPNQLPPMTEKELWDMADNYVAIHQEMLNSYASASSAFGRGLAVRWQYQIVTQLGNLANGDDSDRLISNGILKPYPPSDFARLLVAIRSRIPELPED